MMTREQFIEYATEALSDEALEPLYDQVMEHNGEVIRFGDSGPGRVRSIYATIREVNSIERQLARLTGREPRNFRFGVRLPN